jgi:hypothetical protein
VAIAFESAEAGDAADLETAIEQLMLAWCPAGSDPGLCLVIGNVPAEVVDFGRRCQTELVTQADARELAKQHSIRLSGLGGTNDGVIGALAATGLMATGDDGRVIYLGKAATDHFDISGVYPVNSLQEFGVDEVRNLQSQELVTNGAVALGKRLRPSYRQGKVVLFVSPATSPGTDWLAERVL